VWAKVCCNLSGNSTQDAQELPEVRPLDLHSIRLFDLGIVHLYTAYRCSADNNSEQSSAKVEVCPVGHWVGNRVQNYAQAAEEVLYCSLTR
jgi:hypothetical protein